MESLDALCEELRRAMPGPHEREPRSLRRDIEDELADHLACSIERERARGLGEPQARAAAIERFGNPGRIARKLWMQAMKEHVMRDRLIVAVNILLAVVIVFAAVMVYRISEQSQKSNLALVSALERIGKAQAAPAVSNMASMTVRCTRNTSEGTPANLEVSIFGKPFNVTEEKRYSQNVDGRGTTKFGPMLPGKYILSAITKSTQPLLSTSRNVLLYAGDQREEQFVAPDVQTVPVTFSLEMPEEFRNARALIECQIVHVPQVVNGSEWSCDVDPIVVNPAGKLFDFEKFDGGSVDIGPEAEIEYLRMWARGFRIHSIVLYEMLNRTTNNGAYERIAEHPYGDSGPVFELQAGGMNRLKISLPQDILEKIRMQAILAKSSLDPDSVDMDLLNLVHGDIQRILPVNKDATIISYLPDWNHGDVDNLAVANNDGGVRVLLDWEIPDDLIKSNCKYIVALYSRKTDYRFENDNDAKGAILASEIEANWPEMTSWKTQPAIAREPFARFDMTKDEGWKLFDVTPVVRARAEQKHKGSGIELHFAKENLSGNLKTWSGYSFISREGYGDLHITGDGPKINQSACHPMLIVVSE